MGKLFTAVSAFALTAILATGAAYAIEGTEPDATPVLEITSSTPASGTTLAALTDGSEITITPANFEEYPEMYIMYEIQNRMDGQENWTVYKSEVWMYRDNERKLYHAKLPINYPLYVDTEYRIQFTAWATEMDKNYREDPIGVGYITGIKGSTERYQNSPYKLVKMTPEPAPEDDMFNEVVLPADCTQLTATFDGPVRIDEEGTGILIGLGAGFFNFGEIQPVDPVEKDGIQYAAEWNLIFADGFLANRDASMDISMKAYDEEGRVVLGNTGTEEHSYFIFRYNVPGMFLPLSFDFGPEPRSNVSSVLVSAAKPVNYSWLRSYNEAVVYGPTGDPVAQVKTAQQVFEPGQEDKPDAESIGSRLIFDTVISTPGIYTLKVPAGYFFIGAQFDTASQAAQEVEFTVSEGVNYNVTPAAGKVESLDVITVSYDVAEALTIVEDAELPYLLCGESMTKVGFRQVITEGKALTLTLKAAITEPETYTLVVPTGYVKAGEQVIPDIAVEYVIEKAEQPGSDMPCEVTPAPGKVDALPDQLYLTFTNNFAVNQGAGKATISVNGGEPVALGDTEWGAENNEIIQPLGKFASMSTDGTYTISFPDGYFAVDDAFDVPAFEIVYTIGEGGGDTPVEKVNVAVNATNAICYALTVDEGAELVLNYTELPDNWKVENVKVNGKDMPDFATEVAFPAGYLTSDTEVIFELSYDGELTFVDKTTGVVALDSKITIQVVDGKIRIENLNGEQVVVYNLGGMVMGRHTANNEALEITLPAGTYIVTVNGNAVKVML